MKIWFLKSKKRRVKFNCDFKADGLGTKGKSLRFMEEPKFKAAVAFAAGHSEPGWKKGVPDIRWRQHMALWAARHALHLDGDFVECGVHTGLLSLAICHYLPWAGDRAFWLFDTWAGIPLDKVTEEEREMAEKHNRDIYGDDVFADVERAFKNFKNVHLVRGVLPATLAAANIRKIAYLSIDLNNAAAESECIEALWDRVTAGGIILLDDYGWKNHEAQQNMWDAFAASQGRMIAMLPTGQGLLIK